MELLEPFEGAIELIDPRSADFQKNLAAKAGKLADDLLETALDKQDISAKTQALNSYSKYRQVIQNDTTTIIEQLSQMDDKKLKVLESALKRKKMLEDFKSGDMSLEQVYSLPSAKKKRKKKA